MKSDAKRTILFFQKISVKVTLLILVILLVGIGITILYYSVSQNTILVDSRIDAVREQGDTVYISIKNNMLAGEAPIAVDLFRDLTKMGFIKLFRPNGISAFSDNITLEKVNSNLKNEMFKAKEIFSEREINSDDNFKKAVDNIDEIFVRDIRKDKKEIIIYKPLINQPKCSACHGIDHVIRGILVISTSIDEVYKRANDNTILSAIIYGIVVLILSCSIIIFLHRFVIRRIFKIGTVVTQVGGGDFKTKIDVKNPDEIGRLSGQINDMIDGLNERFKLTRFVSKSTLDHVKETDEINLGGEKKTITVMFTDIRGFTSFSEQKDPADVMNILNEVMNQQAEIVGEYGGDIDKFVGDELMALFEGDDMVIRAVKCAEKIRATVKEKFSSNNRMLYLGIGINTGEMISGNMGAGNRMDRTVIGDAVNLGSRLCSIAGRNVIVLSEHSYNYVKDAVVAREHPPIKVKGKEKPVRIYTLRKTL